MNRNDLPLCKITVMHIVRARDIRGTIGPAVQHDGAYRYLGMATMAELLQLTLGEIRALCEHPLGAVVESPTLLSPIDGRTEVWASGVTYARSREARLEESTQHSVYELVYDAERPELFFKAPAWRVMTDGEPVAIRADSAISVPEPELALVLTSSREVLGYLVCNDMSSRSIEGENPLYLPQAKLYAGACALSTGIRPAWEISGDDRAISLAVERAGLVVLEDATSTAAIHRPFDALVEHLFRAENFPDGVVLATGTGIVPATSFTLQQGDHIRMTIEGVGELANPVVVGPEHFREPARVDSSTITMGARA